MSRTTVKLVSVYLLASLLILPQLAAAAPPPLLPLQGYLTDDSDVALNGAYKLAFTLYDDALTGTSQYTSTEAVSVSHGNFTVYLGDQAPLDLKLMQTHDSLWLEIKIVQDCAADTTCNTGPLLNRTLSPRLQLATTAFAASAAYCGDATTIGGQAPSAFAAASHTHAYSSLTGVPATFPPSPHTHPWSDITGAPSFATGNQACTGTQKVTGISASGAVTCGADVDTNTMYSAGAGLAQSGSQFSLMSGCTADQVLKSDGAGGWACKADNDTRYAADPNGGLEISSGAFGLSPCTAGYVLKSTGTSWTCQLDANSGGTLTGVATASGSGLTGGCTSGSCSLAVDATGLVGTAPATDGGDTFSSHDISTSSSQTNPYTVAQTTVTVGHKGVVLAVASMSFSCAYKNTPATSDNCNAALTLDLYNRAQTYRIQAAGQAWPTATWSNLAATGTFVVPSAGTYTIYALAWGWGTANLSAVSSQRAVVSAIFVPN